MAYTIQPQKCRLVSDGRKIKIARERTDNCDDALAIARAMLRGLPHEELLAILLDGANRVRGVARVSMGGTAGCACVPADVLRPAIVAGARAIILAHNHPSGDARPSSEDVAMTRGIGEACRIVGLALLDHMIVTDGLNHSSALEGGWL
jgi:DNA repair protein RadC